MNKELAISSEHLVSLRASSFLDMYFPGIPSNLMLHKFGARNLDGADSGDLGSVGAADRRGATRAAVVCAAIFTGAGGGGIFSRCGIVSDVPGSVSGSRHSA